MRLLSCRRLGAVLSGIDQVRFVAVDDGALSSLVPAGTHPSLSDGLVFSPISPVTTNLHTLQRPPLDFH
ncbi:unnamed protein product [Mesocestoides corti]|uniref:Uncharacterized protein n=1 Tax=Mesocestoides corti TaxID=53468 RepID=A0A0R3UCB3_MESCO|nr:unnamed protein product [Mesocestoides corti]